jgi:imidazole glycerol-phosphate synthase subunit HisH
VRVTVVDYGMGNLFSVCRAVERCGGEPRLSSDPAEVAAAAMTILPGVGAFGDAMAELERRDLVEPLRDLAAARMPLLGICLGMQMMLDSSEEFGQHAGLGLIPGHVRPIPTLDTRGHRQKVPQVGWNGLVLPEGRENWAGTTLQDLLEGDSTYFVHSFAAEPVDPAHRLADCLYGGHRVGAAIADGPIVGCQFHPEKSGPVGLTILRRFILGEES